MHRIPSFDTHQERRQALTRSLSWALFLAALVLSLLALGLSLWDAPELRRARTFAIIFGYPGLVLLLTLFYWLQTTARALSWQEVTTLYVLRLILWIGTFWQFLCLVYLLVDWASGRGVLIWFPS